MVYWRFFHKHARTICVLLLVAAATWGALLNGAAAAFKPAPDGTQITYTDRTCTIVANSNGLVQCRLESGEIYTRAFGLEIVGPLKPHGGFLTFLSRTACAGPITPIREIELSASAARKLGSLWPLEVGKSVRYSITVVTNGAFGDNEANAKFRIRAKVERRERVTTSGGTFDAFVVVQKAQASCDANMTTNTVGYERKFWLSPETGIVIKETMNWTMGPLYGGKASSELVSLRLRGVATKVEKAPQTTPVAAAAETKQPDRPPQPASSPKQTASRTAAPAESLSGLHFGRYHALVIGNNDYDELTALQTAVADATAVAGLLRRDYGFEVTLLTNANRRAVVKSLANYRRTLKPNDNLLIYYAGHGVLDQVTEQGYWLPVDAERDDPTNWIEVTSVTNMIRAIRAKHVMIVADSCYSGTLVRDANVQLPTQEARTAWIRRMISMRSRTALASGGLEPVTDSGGGGHSVFAKAFLHALEENPDILDGQSLFDKIKRPVVLDADQTPRYADIRKAGHEGGDFLFVKKRN